MHREPANAHEANDLYLFVANTGELYPMRKNIEAKLMKFYQAGKYDSARAVKAFRYLIDAGVPMYRREIERDADEPAPRFSPATRDAAAVEFVELFEANARGAGGARHTGGKQRGGKGRGPVRYPTTKKPSDPTYSAQWSGVTGAPRSRGLACSRCGGAVHREGDSYYCPSCDDYVTTQRRGGKRRKARSGGAGLIAAAKALKAAMK